MDHPRLAELCTKLLADPVWYVRGSACECVYFASVAVPAALLLVLVEFDPHEYVRYWAALALGRAAASADVPRMLVLQP